jgi:hypothetical protein
MGRLRSAQCEEMGRIDVAVPEFVSEPHALRINEARPVRRTLVGEGRFASIEADVMPGPLHISRRTEVIPQSECELRHDQRSC